MRHAQAVETADLRYATNCAIKQANASTSAFVQRSHSRFGSRSNCSFPSSRADHGSRPRGVSASVRMNMRPVQPHGSRPRGVSASVRMAIRTGRTNGDSYGPRWRDSEGAGQAALRERGVFPDRVEGIPGDARTSWGRERGGYRRELVARRLRVAVERRARWKYASYVAGHDADAASDGRDTSRHVTSRFGSRSARPTATNPPMGLASPRLASPQRSNFFLMP